MLRALLLLVLAFVIGMVAGCGGSSGLHWENGQQVDDDDHGPDIVGFQSDIRQGQAGDEWEYTVTGSVSDGTSISEVTGTYTETISADTVITPLGETARVVLESAVLSYSGGIHIVANSRYVTQDANGTMWAYGGKRGGTTYWVVSPSEGRYVGVVSPMLQGATWQEDVLHSDSTTFDIMYTASGREVITVPAGAFDCCRVTGNGPFAGLPAVVKEWWAPQIGAPARSEVVFTDSSLTFMLTLELSVRSR